MQLTSIAAIGAFATAAAAVNLERGFTYPASVPHVEKRQTSGPKYECHSNCGYALQAVEDGDEVCNDKEWNTLYQGCLDCALEFDIWRYYGGGLTPAAKACGLSTTPTPADGGDVDEPASTTTAQSATAVPVSSTTSEEQATTTVIEEVVTITAVSSEPSQTGDSAHVDDHVTDVDHGHSETPAWSTTQLPATTSQNNGTTPEPTNVPGAAAQFWLSNVVVGGAAVVIAANLL
ncbi:uncharacterized protein F5Z01DRAFT_676154 [Emericellopsis atlantica]|uniref:Uncharacterized protein n=1 Tax=Emericellopsis atlantica TaxID=2614577 RepID=A0A9P7ZHM0_9HYPO|nr:uncharacterized protein F5Z01DRAFT_676154 [Emericellopsis atlantica]KAG9252274.1 hypothetical protein F5Z01DRAFT_676154 [Emericellopsis atlantica]